MGRIEFNDAGAPKAYNQLAREERILKLLQDIRVDLQICKIEGWDKREYLNRLKEVINSLGRK